MSETRFQILLSTAGSAAEAREIARALVERRLAACVNIIDAVRSIYRWQGEIVEEGEWLLIIKTRAELFEAVRDAIRTLHSYETPEVVALNVSAVDADYLAWLGLNTDAAS